jgi:NADH:ubiquinone oxidoreductase subunit K
MRLFNNLGLEHYLILSALLFSIGLYGALTKRNAVIILMCIELMLNAVNITMVAFSRYIVPSLLTGQVFAIFIIVVAAAEVAVGLAIILSIYRGLETIDATKTNLMKW